VEKVTGIVRLEQPCLAPPLHIISGNRPQDTLSASAMFEIFAKTIRSATVFARPPGQTARTHQRRAPGTGGAAPDRFALGGERHSSHRSQSSSLASFTASTGSITLSPSPARRPSGCRTTRPVAFCGAAGPPEKIGGLSFSGSSPEFAGEFCGTGPCLQVRPEPLPGNVSIMGLSCGRPINAVAFLPSLDQPGLQTSACNPTQRSDLL
jgi:hypothetical protein